METEMVKFMNVARQFPAYFINLIDRQLESFLNSKEMPISEDMIYETNEGQAAWKDARKFLQQQKSLPPFQVHQGLVLSAEQHVLDLAQHNLFGHTGSDKSSFSERILRHCRKGQGAMAEIIGADFHLQRRNHPEMTVLGLIIDDGVPDRGHRLTIFNPNYRHIGCKSAVQGDKVITVFNLTENRLTLRGQSHLAAEPSQTTSTSAGFNNLKMLSGDNNYSKTEADKIKTAKRDILNQVSNRQGRKVSEKKENTRIYYEGGAKVTEKYSQVFYSDGTMEENIEKHTVYP